MSNQKRKRKKNDNEIQTTDSHNKQTALYYAAEKGHLDVCRLLIDRGADVNAKVTLFLINLQNVTQNSFHDHIRA